MISKNFFFSEFHSTAILHQIKFWETAIESYRKINYDTLKNIKTIDFSQALLVDKKKLLLQFLQIIPRIDKISLFDKYQAHLFFTNKKYENNSRFYIRHFHKDMSHLFCYDHNIMDWSGWASHFSILSQTAQIMRK